MGHDGAPGYKSIAGINCKLVFDVSTFKRAQELALFGWGALLREYDRVRDAIYERMKELNLNPEDELLVVYAGDPQVGGGQITVSLHPAD